MDENCKHIGRYIGRLYNLLRRNLWRDTYELECSGAEVKILSYILGSPEPRLQRDIEEEFLLRPPTATEMLKKMEAEGLIKRVHEEGDARCKRIIPTQKSLDKKEMILGRFDDFEARITAGIPEKDLRGFCRAAERMMENLSRSPEAADMEENA